MLQPAKHAAMNLPRILDLIESVKDVKALFIGETIIDEYRFVSAMGKPAKESVLAVRLHESEIYCGGVAAAQSHADSFCLTTCLTNGSGIRKARYVEENYTRKLFEVQTIPDNGLDVPISDEVLSRHEIIIITDYGHGMFRRGMIDRLCTCGRFLAVTAQTNAVNMGFNLITKYPRADYIVIDEPEARWAAHDRDSPIEDVMRKLADGRCNKLIVTQGKHGASGLHDGQFLHVDTFNKNVVDTMGAGDAFFAVTAPMAKAGCLEDLLHIGNAAGALKTHIVGHRGSVTKTALIEYLTAYGNC